MRETLHNGLVQHSMVRVSLKRCFEPGPRKFRKRYVDADHKDWQLRGSHGWELVSIAQTEDPGACSAVSVGGESRMSEDKDLQEVGFHAPMAIDDGPKGESRMHLNVTQSVADQQDAEVERMKQEMLAGVGRVVTAVDLQV